MMPVLPRGSRSVIGRSTNVGDTSIMKSIERSRSAGPTTAKSHGKQRITRLDQQFITAPGEGDPVGIPSGWWATTVQVHGDWDDIVAGFTYTNTSGDTLPFSAWCAHRPDGSAEASGELSSFAFEGGTITPSVAVDGSGGGDVSVTVRFDPCEAP